MEHTHIGLPEELLAQIDALVGKHKRSEFITEVLEKGLRRRRRMEMADEMMDSLKEADIPGWETAESIDQWVHAQRKWPDPWQDTENDDTITTES